jgi:hypothetical protein
MFRIIVFIIILFMALPYVNKVKDKIFGRINNSVVDAKSINKTLDSLKKTSNSLKDRIKK